MQPCMKSQMLRKDKTELAPALASAGDGNASKMTKKKKKKTLGDNKVIVMASITTRQAITGMI